MSKYVKMLVLVAGVVVLSSTSAMAFGKRKCGGCCYSCGPTCTTCEAPAPAPAPAPVCATCAPECSDCNSCCKQRCRRCRRCRGCCSSCCY